MPYNVLNAFPGKSESANIDGKIKLPPEKKCKKGLVLNLLFMFTSLWMIKCMIYDDVR